MYSIFVMPKDASFSGKKEQKILLINCIFADSWHLNDVAKIDILITINQNYIVRVKHLIRG